MATKPATLFQEYLTIEGRMARGRFFCLWLGLIAASLVADILISLIGSGAETALLVLMFCLTVLVITGNVSIISRRWHDLGKSAWFTLLSFVPVINFIALLVLFFAPGTPGPNRFGANPLAPRRAMPRKVLPKQPKPKRKVTR